MYPQLIYKNMDPQIYSQAGRKKNKKTKKRAFLPGLEMEASTTQEMLWLLACKHLMPCTWF